MTPTLILVALLLAACWFDIRTRRIPNVIIVLGVAWAVFGSNMSSVLGHGNAGEVLAPSVLGVRFATAPLASATGALLGALLLLPMYALRACAAGDVKLMVMVGAFIGPGMALVAGLCTMVAGGLLGVVFMAKPGVARATAANLGRMLRVVPVGSSARLNSVANVADGGAGTAPSRVRPTAARLPYALAITAGTAMALVWAAHQGAT